MLIYGIESQKPEMPESTWQK